MTYKILSLNEFEDKFQTLIDNLSDEDFSEVFKPWISDTVVSFTSSLRKEMLRKIECRLSTIATDSTDFRRALPSHISGSGCKYYAWLSTFVADGEVWLPTYLLRYIATERNMPETEDNFLRAVTIACRRVIIGAEDNNDYDNFNEVGRTLCDFVDERNIHFLDIDMLSDVDMAYLRKKIDKDKKDSEGWGHDPIDLEKALDGNVVESLHLMSMVRMHGDLSMRLVGHLCKSDCVPAHHIGRIIRGYWTKQNKKIEAKDIEAYRKSIGDITVSDTPKVKCNPGEVLLAPNLADSQSKSGYHKGIVKGYELLAKPMMMHRSALSPEVLREQLLSEFPWMLGPVDLIIRDLSLRENYGQQGVNLPPMLIHGPPGTGKTRLVQRMAKLMNIPSDMLSLAGSADDRMLRGTGSGYSSAQPCWPIVKVAESKCPDPLLIFDEIDKVKAGGHQGDPWATILMFTEPVNAKAYLDECLQAGVDISYVNFIATANDISALPMPLLSRFRVLETGRPEPEHVRAIISGVRADFAQEVDVDPRFVPELDEVEMTFLEDTFRTHGNVRAISRMTQKLLDRRERLQRERPH